MQRFSTIILSMSLILFAFPSKGEECICPTETHKTLHDRPTIAFALGGGGARGAAHVGVLRVLEREHIPIDYIAGCSMGAIIGGLYSAGVPLDKIEQVLKDKSLQKAYAPGHVTTQLILSYLNGIRYAFQDKPYAGLFSGKKFAKFITKCLPESKQNMEDLDISFCAVATNLKDGQAYKLTKGNLSQAILASSALPPVVRPVEIDGNLYVDGGVRANLPTISAAQYKPDILIAVPVDECLNPVDIRRFTSVRAVANRVTSIVLSVVDAYHLQKADLAITPDVSDISVLSKRTSDINKAIIAGEEAANKALPEIKEAIAKWRANNETANKDKPNNLN